MGGWGGVVCTVLFESNLQLHWGYVVVELGLWQKLKMLIFGIFRTKTKKLWMDSERKWKVCFIKVPLFLLKNACGASYKQFYIFFVVPLRGHFRHASPVQILIFFFFHWQLTADLSERYGIIFKLFWFSRRLTVHPANQDFAICIDEFQVAGYIISYLTVVWAWDHPGLLVTCTTGGEIWSEVVQFFTEGRLCKIHFETYAFLMSIS